MIRRTARLRREYLYRKSLEGKEKVKYEHKRALKKALEGMFPILIVQSVTTCIIVGPLGD